MNDSKMKKHVTVVGAIQIGFSILGFIGAFAVFFALNFAKGFVGDSDIPVTVLTFLSISLPILIGCISTIGLVGAIGMLQYKNWGRILVIVVAVMGLLSIPVGTLKGVYFIWVLMQDETVKMFKPEGKV